MALRTATLLVLRKWLIIFMNMIQPCISATRFLVNFTAGWDLLAQKPANFKLTSLHVKLFSNQLKWAVFFFFFLPLCAYLYVLWMPQLLLVLIRQSRGYRAQELLSFRALQAETPCCVAKTPWLKPHLWTLAPQKFPCPPSSPSGGCPSGYKPLHRLVLRGTSPRLQPDCWCSYLVTKSRPTHLQPHGL